MIKIAGAPNLDKAGGYGIVPILLLEGSQLLDNGRYCSGMGVLDFHHQLVGGASVNDQL